MRSEDFRVGKVCKGCRAGNCRGKEWLWSDGTLYVGKSEVDGKVQIIDQSVCGGGGGVVC